MKKLLTLAALLITLNCFAQNTVTLESGTSPVTPTFRYKAITPDSLNHLWMLWNGKYNRVYTATELGVILPASYATKALVNSKADSTRLYGSVLPTYQPLISLTPYKLAATSSIGALTTLSVITHDAVDLATAMGTALPANTYNNGIGGLGATLTATANGLLVVDGVNVVSGYRILVKSEATGAYDGIYTVTQIGDSTHPYILTRGTYSSIAANMGAGTFVYVKSGATNAGYTFRQVNASNVTIGSTALTYTANGLFDSSTITGYVNANGSTAALLTVNSTAESNMTGQNVGGFFAITPMIGGVQDQIEPLITVTYGVNGVTIPILKGIEAGAYFGVTGSAVTTGYAVEAYHPNMTAGGTITNWWSLHISGGSSSGITNDNAILSESTGKSLWYGPHEYYIATGNNARLSITAGALNIRGTINGTYINDNSDNPVQRWTTGLAAVTGNLTTTANITASGTLTSTSTFTTLGLSNIGNQTTTTTQAPSATFHGYNLASSGSALIGDYAFIPLNGNGNYTGNGRPFAITTALNGNSFAILVGANSTTPPTLNSSGAISSGSLGMSIDYNGATVFGSSVTTSSSVNSATLNVTGLSSLAAANIGNTTFTTTFATSATFQGYNLTSGGSNIGNYGFMALNANGSFTGIARPSAITNAYLGGNTALLIGSSSSTAPSLTTSGALGGSTLVAWYVDASANFYAPTNLATAGIVTNTSAGKLGTVAIIPAANLGSGTANNTTVLYGDGVYRTATGGSVSSITPGYGFTSSTPITSSGTLTIDTTKIQTVANFKPLGTTLFGRLNIGNTWTATQVFSANINTNAAYPINFVNGSYLTSFSGSTALTGNQSIILPNATGTVALTYQTGTIQALADFTGLSAANASIATYTLGVANGTFRIGGYLNITAVTLDVIQMSVTYTDENNTSQTAIFYGGGSTSAGLSAIGNSNFPTIDIRCKASTAITVKSILTTGTGSIAYDTGATITQLR